MNLATHLNILHSDWKLLGICLEGLEVILIDSHDQDLVRPLEVIWSLNLIIL